MKSVSAAILVLSSCILISFSELPNGNPMVPLERPWVGFAGCALGLIGMFAWTRAFLFEKS
ncbi:hypothetical protein Pan258_16050 [Symmachiella dynata]|nr:hypothetical protein Pan258_16050 [Symmachiella dynata]